MRSKQSRQEGSALFFAIVIMAILTSSLMALVAVSLGQIKGMLMLSDSVVAFCAADSGIDKSLYRLFKSDPSWVSVQGRLIYPDLVPEQNCPSAQWETLSGYPVEYQVCVHPSDDFIFLSTGNYKPTGVKRKIEANLN